MSTAELPPSDDEPIHLEQPLVGMVEEAYAPYEAFTLSFEAYEKACRDYVRLPSRKHEKSLEERTGLHVRTFQHMLIASIPDSNLADFYSFATASYMEEERRRVTMLNELAGTEITTVGNHGISINDESAEIVEQLDDESLTNAKRTGIDKMCEFLIEGIETDNSNLTTYASNSDGSRKAHLIEVAMQTGKDVGKIAAGTALGLIVARRFFR